MIACIQRPSFPSSTEVVVGLCGISVPFGTLSHSLGKVSYVLLTRTPRYRGRIPFAFDLHVLGPPLTFALSQDQTLQLNFRCFRRNSINRERLPELLNQFVENWLHLHGYELVARNHTRPLRVREFHSRDNVSQCLVITDSPIQFSRTVYSVQNTELGFAEFAPLRFPLGRRGANRTLFFDAVKNFFRSRLTLLGRRPRCVPGRDF